MRRLSRVSVVFVVLFVFVFAESIYAGAIAMDAIKKDDDRDDDCKCEWREEDERDRGVCEEDQLAWRERVAVGRNREVFGGGRREIDSFGCCVCVLQLSTRHFTALRRVPCCRKRAVSMTESWILAGVHRYVRVAHFYSALFFGA